MGLFNAADVLNRLQANLEWSYQGGLYGANLAATTITNAISAAITDAVTLADQHARDADTQLMNNVNGRLTTIANQVNSAGTVTQQQLDTQLNDAFAIYDAMQSERDDALRQAVDSLWEVIGTTQETASGTIMGGLEQAYDGIASALIAVKEDFSDMMSFTSGALEKVYQIMGQGLRETMGSVGTSIVSMSKTLLDLPALIIDKVANILIPEEMKALIDTLGQVLVSNPVISLMQIVGNIFSGVYEGLFKFDEPDFQDGLKHALESFSNMTQVIINTPITENS